jgi:SAM-dependent methyltransferase
VARKPARREDDAALRANLSTYDELDEKQYVNGAPHLKHASIGAIHRDLISEAIQKSGRPPTELSVLDLGAGNGLGSTEWLRRKVQLTAVDSSESMLRGFRQNAARFGVTPKTVVAGVLEYLKSSQEKFDVVTHVSMLHHIPDYLELLRLSAGHVRPGGCLLTFQDPLRFADMRPADRFIERGFYFVWRLGQGNYGRGLKTRWRRLRGVYSDSEAVDFDEYHLVRGGVDSAAIANQLKADFSDVKVVEYWSTYSRPLQKIGERIGLKSNFGILASGRKPA